MNILLVNANPVVSRLFALCSRDAKIVLEEVEKVDGLSQDKRYDLLFVDDASFAEDVREYIEEGNTEKKILLSYSNENVPDFDLTLQKPFLPSQILALLESVPERKENELVPDELVIFPVETEKKSSKTASIFPLAKEEIEEAVEEKETVEIGMENPHILDSREIEKIKDLLDMDEEEILPVEEELSEEAVEEKKVKAITEQLIAEGLEIVDEDEIVEIFQTDKKSPKKHKIKEVQPLGKKELKRIKKAFDDARLKLKPKKIKKLLGGKKVEIVLQLKDHR